MQLNSCEFLLHGKFLHGLLSAAIVLVLTTQTQPECEKALANKGLLLVVTLSFKELPLGLRKQYDCVYVFPYLSCVSSSWVPLGCAVQQIHTYILYYHK